MSELTFTTEQVKRLLFLERENEILLENSCKLRDEVSAAWKIAAKEREKNTLLCAELATLRETIEDPRGLIEQAVQQALVSEHLDLMEELAALRAVALAAEWYFDISRGEHICPACKRSRIHGHTSHCPYITARAAGYLPDTQAKGEMK